MSALWLLIGMLLGTGAAWAWRGRPAAGVPPEELLGSVREGLGRLDAHLHALERARDSADGRLELQLGRLVELGEALRTQTGELAGALRRPNVRGQWGQVQLRRVVELAGMVAHCDFVEQARLPSGGRPDLIVTLPGGRQVVVDAKAPLDAVLDAAGASDAATRRAHLATHARALRAHVEELAGRAYAGSLSRAPELVVLFLPGEHLYGAALEADPTLLEDAMARRVLIATPTTLLAILRAIAHGWSEQQVADSARAVAELGRELHRWLGRLSGLLATVGARLNGTVRAYNEAVGSYEARVVPAARRLAEHGVGAGDDLPAPAGIALAARTVAEVRDPGAGEELYAVSD